MPNTPFAIAGYVYDVDGSTVVEGAIVGAFNFTKGEWLDYSKKCTTNSSGEYTIDLANLTTQVANGDVIYVYVTYNNKSANARAILTTANITAGSWDLNLYLRWGNLKINEYGAKTIDVEGINSFVASGTAAKTISIVGVTNDNLLIPINVAQHGTTSARIGKPSLYARGGYWILYGAQGTFVTGQSTGTANAIGDTADNKGNLITVN